MTDLLVDPEVPEVDEKKGFYLQNQRFLLTYKTHINKGDYHTWCHDKWTGKYKDLKLHIAHENGKNDPITPYEHSHIILDFGKRFQSKNSRVFDFIVNDDVIHPHIKKIMSKKHLERCYAYLAKEDPENEYLLKLCSKKFDIVRDVFEVSKSDALNNARSASEALAIARLHDEHRDVNNSDSWSTTDEDFELYPWQAQIWGMINTRCRRSNIIHWIWDNNGANGKTTFINYCVDADPKHNYALYALGSHRDVSENISQAIKHGWTGRVLHINLTRSAEYHDGYNALEQLSDGRMTKQKYTGGDVKFKNRYLIVYSNWLPDPNKLTRSRWRVKKLVGVGADAKLIDMDVGSVDDHIKNELYGFSEKQKKLQLEYLGIRN